MDIFLISLSSYLNLKLDDLYVKHVTVGSHQTPDIMWTCEQYIQTDDEDDDDGPVELNT